jgi:hypothetical protein
VLGLLHLERTLKACFRKLVRDEEGKQYLASGLFKRLWVILIWEEDSLLFARLSDLARPQFKLLNKVNFILMVNSLFGSSNDQI